MRSAILLLLPLAAALAQSPQERGKLVIDETIKALGGPEFLRMRNRVETGRAYSFYREELSGLSVATIYVRYREAASPPATGELLVDERESFGKQERYGAVLFTGGKGFEITFRGARPLAEERLTRYRDSTLHNVLYILRERLAEPGMILEAKGSEVMDNYPVDVVDITDPDNRTVTVYIHKSTRLPLRQRYYWRDPKTGDRNEEVTLFDKYRDIGSGIQWPYDTQRLRNGDRQFQLYADAVQANQELADKLFELPAGIKILRPVK